MQPPDRDALDRTYNALKALHATAHNWSPPDVEGLERLPSNRMRQYVRAWINEWDLVMLDPTYRHRARRRKCTWTSANQPISKVKPKAVNETATDRLKHTLIRWRTDFAIADLVRSPGLMATELRDTLRLAGRTSITTADVLRSLTGAPHLFQRAGGAWFPAKAGSADTD